MAEAGDAVDLAAVETGTADKKHSSGTMARCFVGLRSRRMVMLRRKPEDCADFTPGRHLGILSICQNIPLAIAHVSALSIARRSVRRLETGQPRDCTHPA